MATKAKKAAGKKAAKKTTAKTGLKFGSPEWQAKYGRGKKKSKK